MSKRRICVVTSTRADYGLLYWPMRRVAAHGALELQVVVTGTHLSPAHGLSVAEIHADGFSVAAEVPLPLDDDSPVGIARVMGRATEGLAEAYARLRPDLVMLLGDRYEILAAAQAALVARLPIAHLAGGDVTTGAFDDAIRHSLTKMAHLHFVTNPDSAKRVRQLGEDPARIHTVGSPGLDFLRHAQLLDRAALEADLGLQFQERNLLITYHPETLADQAPEAALAQVLTALGRLPGNVGLIFTAPNADPGNRRLRDLLNAFVSQRPHAWLCENLGSRRYWSTMACVDAVVGNSSSGIYEAPSLQVPTVNIGGRQDGRLMAASVICCPPEPDAVCRAIDTALAGDWSTVVNPYGDGRASERIVDVLAGIPDYQSMLRKPFCDL